MTEEDLVMWLEPLRRHLHTDYADYLLFCFNIDNAYYQKMQSSERGMKTKFSFLCVFSFFEELEKLHLDKGP